MVYFFELIPYFQYICQMQYKSMRFIVSLVTSIIMLGHTFVPHHHAEEHGHGHRHSHHHENKGIKDLFSHHCHSSDCFTSLQKYEIGKTVQQLAPGLIISHSIYRALTTFYKPVQNTYECDYTYISPHLVHLDFRGPPSLSV